MDLSVRDDVRVTRFVGYVQRPTQPRIAYRFCRMFAELIASVYGRLGPSCRRGRVFRAVPRQDLFPGRPGPERWEDEMNVRRCKVGVVAVALTVALAVPVSVWAAEPGYTPAGPVGLWQSLVDLWEGWIVGWNDQAAQPESDLRTMEAAADTTTTTTDPTLTDPTVSTTGVGTLGLTGTGGGDTEGGTEFDPGS
jgi:hypothetical protein